ncbi:unnamed protein product [Sphenostylis stenocarpa]|uniref:Uncharacterized protein n=1 Tax=Sphenostylis stenocarpa TaxID=92480 RepID=A0AA86RPJ5_9FABA|nr:unnamed protein product [Sphenostylis stenocarpa]
MTGRGPPSASIANGDKIKGEMAQERSTMKWIDALRIYMTYGLVRSRSEPLVEHAYGTWVVDFWVSGPYLAQCISTGYIHVFNISKILKLFEQYPSRHD